MSKENSVLNNHISENKIIKQAKKVVELALNRKSLIVFFIGIMVIQSCNNLPLTESSVDTETIVTAEKIEEVEVISVEPEVEIPDFSAFNNVKLKKKTFFNFIYDFVETVNMEVKSRRIKIAAIAQKNSSELTAEDRLFIDKMSSLYLNQHDPSDTLATAKILLTHVDIVPPSLALAQAANESGWGTSRFATDANNYFGQWCFREGCGLVPEQRSADSNFEVRKFNSVEDSVRSYIRNINTHRAYAELREIRQDIRQNGEFPNGENLTEGLSHYSERGEDYIIELQSMIRFNKLSRFDEIFQSLIKEKHQLENKGDN